MSFDTLHEQRGRNRINMMAENQPSTSPLPIKIKYLIGILGISTIALLVATIVQSTRSDADCTDTAQAQTAGADLVRLHV